jgi:anti-anti-sigma factor
VEIGIRTEMNRAILTLKGDLSGAHDLAALQRTISDLLGKGVRDFTLRLDAVTYVASAGLGQIVQLFSIVKREGGDLRVVRPSPSCGVRAGGRR